MNIKIRHQSIFTFIMSEMQSLNTDTFCYIWFILDPMSSGGVEYATLDLGS